MMELMNVVLPIVKRTFWEEIVYEFQDFFGDILDFFMMIKNYTYDVLVEHFGEITSGMMLVALAAGIVAITATAIIRR